ncbi:MAG: hypothetical protein J5631_07010 [Spirochaetaceae bacterium]|nr:hypothetical protein [Spirochaetaceae bacterium]
MNEKKALEIYESLARPPAEALRQIQGGKLNGKTDINPQWRYKAMTEKFGLVGIGWKYEVQKLWFEAGAGSEKLAFAQVAVFVKDGDAWSEPIVGIGGSKLVQFEKGAAVSNDEGYKMAVTDAFSTALKMLGVAADIYANKWDGSKYKDEPETPPQQPAPQRAPAPQPPKKQPAKFAFEPKGGETTPEEKKELGGLLSTKYPDGGAVFSKAEAKKYSDMRKDYTAREVIETIKRDLNARLNPTSQMQTAGDVMRAQQQKAAQELPPQVEAVKEAFNGEVVTPPQQSFDDMQPVEQSPQGFDIY